jgi:hypothetical protein
MIATRSPACVRRLASDDPAWPEPMKAVVGHGARYFRSARRPSGAQPFNSQSNERPDSFGVFNPEHIDIGAGAPIRGHIASSAHVPAKWKPVRR